MNNSTKKKQGKKKSPKPFPQNERSDGDLEIVSTQNEIQEKITTTTIIIKIYHEIEHDTKGSSLSQIVVQFPTFRNQIL